MTAQQSSTNYFIYARKSSESEDQQVASIDSQIRELQSVAKRENITIVDVLSESQSAKAPGRPIFNDMLARLSRGGAKGILCWKLDRLARNPVDGGNISWMLQQGIIQRIQTHERTYTPSDNVLMMSVEFGMANQFVRDLSQNVKRGLLSKVEKGWYPGVAKPGYLNDPLAIKGQRKIKKDPYRFPLLKRAFDMVLAGHRPIQVYRKLVHDWGYQTPKRRKLGGKPLVDSIFYRILSDPFYYGLFEFPKNSGNWYRGKHEPMITEEVFWRIQELLGKKGRPRPKTETFAYTGLITCGQCSAAITAEIKEQVVCSVCKYKFSSKNRSACPKCETLINKMKNPKHRRYEYYHCTKRKKIPCSQGVVAVNALETQVGDLLQELTISETFKDWFLKQLDEHKQKNVADQKPIMASLQEAYDDCQKRLNNLLMLKISPQNSNGDLLSDVEFASQKSDFTRKLRGLEQKMANAGHDEETWTENCTRAFRFACYAYTHFQKGSPETKRMILSELGSNHALYNKKLNVSVHKYLCVAKELENGFHAQNSRFEPENSGLYKQKSRALNPAFSTWYPNWDDVRTLFTEETQNIHIPDLKAPIT
jgi:DNA invertase Pin-like site-specific DNA recombinase